MAEINGDKNSDRQRPAATVNDGDIWASIWANPRPDGSVTHNMTVHRLYRDSEGELKRSTSFGPGDLDKLSSVVGKVREVMSQTFGHDVEQGPRVVVNDNGQEQKRARKQGQ